MGKDYHWSVTRLSIRTPPLQHLYKRFILSYDLCNFADDNTLYKCCKSVDEAKQKIESQCTLIIRWFVDNSMKMNAKKCHAIVLSKDPTD